MKKEYNDIEIEVIAFHSEDVITTSCTSDLENTETDDLCISNA